MLHQLQYSIVCARERPSVYDVYTLPSLLLKEKRLTLAGGRRQNLKPLEGRDFTSGSYVSAEPPAAGDGGTGCQIEYGGIELYRSTS
jgi:hypothetical protein